MKEKVGRWLGRIRIKDCWTIAKNTTGKDRLVTKYVDMQYLKYLDTMAVTLVLNKAYFISGK